MTPENSPQTTNQLDTLKALRESISQRWERRREYEWKLSFALWTAIAAFIGIIVGKDNTVKDREGVVYGIILAGLTITALHVLYLVGIISNTLKDLRKLEWVEEIMHKTLPGDLLKLDKLWPENVRWPEAKQGKIVVYHGFVQAAITFVLCACALGVVMGPKHDKPPAAPGVSPPPGATRH